MAPVALILMYSGLPNPQKELSADELAHIQELVAKLDDPAPPQTGHLGFSGYAANWEDAHVIAYTSGCVAIYTSDGKVSYHYDTTGVMAYLCQLLTPVLVAHMKEMEAIRQEVDKACADYVATINPYGHWDITPFPYK